MFGWCVMVDLFGYLLVGLLVYLWLHGLFLLRLFVIVVFWVWWLLGFLVVVLWFCVFGCVVT